MKEIIEKAIRHYGRQHQQIKAAEELGELQTAILKGLDGRLDFNNLMEEIADVEIVLAQLKRIHFIDPDKLETIKIEKLLRLKIGWKLKMGYKIKERTKWNRLLDMYWTYCLAWRISTLGYPLH